MSSSDRDTKLPTMGDFERFTTMTRAARRRLRRVTFTRRISVLLVGMFVAVLGVFLVKDQAVSRLEESFRLTGNASTTATKPQAEGSRKPVVASGEPFNVLVIGSDRRPPQQRTEETSGARADTLMLVRVEPETGNTRIVSIPRDLLVEIAPDKEGKINSAYTEGGPERVVDVVENYTQVSVDHTVVIGFKGFRELVDAMGGLKIDVEEGLPGNKGLQSGIRTLNGKQALFYVRYRGSAGGDLDRIDRQRQVVAAMRSQMLRLGTVAKLPKLVQALDKNVKSDLDFDEFLSLGKALIQRGQGTQLRSTKLEGTPETLSDGEEVLVPDGGANEQILQDFR